MKGLDEMVQLSKETEYEIQMHPRAETVRGIYLGEAKGEHFFRVEDQEVGYIKMDGYVFLQDHWITQNRDGSLTHKNISSTAVGYMEKDGIEDPNWEYCGVIKKLEQGVSDE